jgi:hypothetical protein
MSYQRWAVLAISAATAVGVISASATALAGSHAPGHAAGTNSAARTNNPTPARYEHAAGVVRGTNNRAPVKAPADIHAIHGSNLPRAQKGSR